MSRNFHVSNFTISVSVVAIHCCVGVARHKLRLDTIDERNGIEVLVAFGAAIAVDHVDAAEIEHDDDGGHDASDEDGDREQDRDGKSKESWHKKHRESD